MKQAMTTTNGSGAARRAMCLAAIALGVPLALAACNDKDVRTTKQTETRTSETPDGVKKTTETTEKKVETEKKDPR